MRDSSLWLRRRAYDPPDNSTQHTWFFRATAIAASWLVLAGYTCFSITLASRDDLKWSADVLASLGGIALGSGYVAGLIAFTFSRSLNFKNDVVVLPTLLSSAGGLFELVLNYTLHNTISVSGAYVYAPLIVASLSTLVLAGTALWINTRLKIRKAVEVSRKQHLELSPDPSGLVHARSQHDDGRAPSIYAEPPASATSASSMPFLFHHNSNTLPSATTNPSFQAFAPPSPRARTTLSDMPLPPPLRHMSSTEIRNTEMSIPEDEAQRRQLLRLLIAKEQQDHPDGNRDPSSNPSPEPSGASSTYRIDWPGAENSEDDDSDYAGMKSSYADTRTGKPSRGARELLPIPDPIDLNFPPPPTKETTSNRWSLGNLLGSPKKKPSPQPMEIGIPGNRPTRATTISDVKMERERRRREIERSSLHEDAGGGGGGNGRDSSIGRGANLGA